MKELFLLELSNTGRLAAAAVALACAAFAVVAITAHSGHAAAPLTAQSQYSALSAPSSASDADLFGSAAAKALAAQDAQLQSITHPRTPYTPDVAGARSRIDNSGVQPQEISIAPAANGGVCLAHRAGSGPLFVVCSDIGTALKQGLVSTSRPAPGPGVDPDVSDVTALVPDEVKSVTFTNAKGAQTTATVVGNVVTTRVDGPTTMSFTSPDAGPQTTNVTPEAS